MNVITDIFNTLEELSAKTLRNTLLLVVSGIFLVAFLYLYKTKYSQKVLRDKYINMINDITKSQNLVAKKQLLDQEKAAALGNLDLQSNKDLLKIVAACASEAEVELDASYKNSFKTISIEHEPDFVEQQISVFSDKLSLKKIIMLINSLRNEKSVMFREFKIENNGKMPACNILLSMRQKK